MQGARITYILPRFAEDLRAVIVPDALVPAMTAIGFSDSIFIEGSNPLCALVIGRL